MPVLSGVLGTTNFSFVLATEGLFSSAEFEVKSLSSASFSLDFYLSI